MCYGEGRGMGRDDFVVVWIGGICWLQWLLWFLRSCAWASHTPAPLERGDCDTVFLLVMKGLSGGVSPLERGLRGVLRRRARDGQR